MGQVVEKVVARALLQYCEKYLKLHARQMGNRNKKSAIDVVAILVHTVQEQWKEKQLAAAFFMDRKGAFNYVSKK